MIKRKIGFDFGFGRIKASDDKGNRIDFPTLLTLRAKSKIDQNNNQKYLVEFEGKTYAVGNFAKVNKIVKEWDRNQSLNKENLSIFIGTCLFIISDMAKDNENNDIEHIDLSLGLPVDFYNDQKHQLKKILTDTKLEIKMQNITKKFVIKRVIVTQQGVGAFAALTLDVDGNLKNDIDEKLLKYGGALIDIGYRTVDYLRIIKQDGSFIISDDESGSIDNSGIYLAHKRASERINEDYGLLYDILHYETIKEQYDGDMMYGSDEVNILKYFDEEYKKLGKEIFNSLTFRWDKIETFGRLYLTGGGGKLLSNYINFNTVIDIQDDPVYANVNGYLAKLAFILNKK